MTAVLVAGALNIAVRTTLLAAAIALILVTFRIRSSTARHAAWAAVLSVMLLMPLLLRIAPSVPVPVPRQVALRVDPLPSVAASPPTLPAALAGATVPPTPITPAAAASPLELAWPTVASKRFQWRTILISGYVAVALFFLLRLLFGLVQLARIRRNSRPVPSVGADVFESSSIVTPVTIGLLKPRVVLPVRWCEWPADMLSAVVAHERAHASRRDPLIALARVNCALYWFHPLAWWLERQLALTAEHACDDAGVTAVTRRRYAETLLEIAATVRRNRGRLAWHAVGVDGGGQLGHRIDRVLSAEASTALSRTRLALVSASCAVLIAAANACRQEIAAVPLREDPQVAAEIKDRAQQVRERQALYEKADAMTREEAAALERVLAQNPGDMATRRKLLLVYGKNKVAGDWKYNALARRPHALWLIQHHPESELVMRARVSQREDPEGYAQARKLWLATIARSDVSPLVLTHAAKFFEGSEKQIAEDILLRGLARQPDGPRPRPAYYEGWKSQLGTMYSYAIIGHRADDPDVRWARERLERTNDPQVLFAAGYDLSWRPAQAEWKALGRQALERAGQLDPKLGERVRALLYQRDVLYPSGAFGGRPPKEWPALLEKSTGVGKLRQLTALAEQEYSLAEYYDWQSRQLAGSRLEGASRGHETPEQSRQRAAEMLARSKNYGQQAIDLASSLTGPGVDEAVFRAHIAYGLAVFREGDRQMAVKHLLQASTLPPPPEPERVGRWASQLEYRLVFYLLKHGERQTIVEYFERAAQPRAEESREVMLKAAAAIRDGRMPEHYQQLVASGRL